MNTSKLKNRFKKHQALWFSLMLLLQWSIGSSQCTIVGDSTACPGGIETYSIDNPPASTNYVWSVNGGSFVGSNVGTSVEVEWGPNIGSYAVFAESFMTNPSLSRVLDYNTECLDLDANTVLVGCGATGDISFGGPIVLTPFVSNGATQAFLSDTAYSDITICDVAGLNFVSLTAPIGVNDVVIVLTAGGTYYKLGNFSPTLTNVTFDVQELAAQCGGGDVCAYAIEIEGDINLACNDMVNISLDENCEAVLTADMLLEGEVFDNSSFEVVVYDNNGVLIPNGTLTGDHLGMILDYRVIHLCTGNTCWGRLRAEDKLIPGFMCSDTAIIAMCGEDLGPFSTGFPLPMGAGTPVAVPGKENTFLVDGFDPCGATELVYTDDITKNGCNANYYIEIIRNWKATDESGNMATCQDTILVERGSLANVTFPRNYDGIDLFFLECDNKDVVYRDPAMGFRNKGWNSLKSGPYEGNPSPFDNPINGTDTLIGTGYPTGVECDHIAVTYKDRKIETCGPNVYKLFRTWRVFDWCTGELLEHLQIIKVADNRAPQVICPTRTPIVTPTDPWQCTGTFLVPAPVFNPNFPQGVTPLMPIILQECSGWTYTIEHLTSDEETCEPGECGAVNLNLAFTTNNVRRLRNGQFEVFNMAQGCHWIKYKITDDCGNSVECGLEVFVEDAGDPVAVCDQHTVISLNEHGVAQLCATSVDNGSNDNCTAQEDLVFKIKRMGESDLFFRDCIDLDCDDVRGPDEDPLMVVFRVYDGKGKSGNCTGLGRYNDCMVEVEVQDKIAPNIVCPPTANLPCGSNWMDSTLTGIPEVEDQCGQVTLSRTLIEDALNDCGVGYVVYQWRAEDRGGRFDVCNQRINLTNRFPFTGRNITWPRDYTINGCELIDAHPNNLPSGFDWPTYNNDDCAKPVAGFEDEPYYNKDGFCIKIIRRWKVIDWCQYDINNPRGGGIWEYVQEVRIRNTSRPVVESGCEDQTVCVNDDCVAIVDFDLVATDDCTPSEDLIWSWEVFTAPGNVKVDEGVGSSVSITFDIGRYSVLFKVKDACGNESICEADVNAEDCKEPTPYCKPGIITTIMPSTGYVEIWASDFNDGSFDNCTDTADLRYSFSTDVSDTGRRIRCADMDQATDTFEYEMWVTDLEGNQDFCRVIVIVQDNQDRCGFGGNITAVIGGVLRTVSDVEVAGVEVDLMKNASFMNEMMTQDDGEYAFYDLEIMQPYEITPLKDDDHVNGVTTADLVLIQRHLLGKGTFTEAEQYIAADANNSQSVSASDISELRKLILGKISSLRNNTSWRFVDANHYFEDQTNPWSIPFPESIKIDPLDDNKMETDFIAIKVGDVNKDVKANGVKGNKTRSGLTFNLEVENQNFKSDEMVQVDFIANGNAMLDAMQFTLQAQDLDFETITPGLLDITEANIGTGVYGAITFSWNKLSALQVDQGDVLFTISYRATGSSNLSTSLELNSEITLAQAYVNDLEKADLNLEFRDRALTQENDLVLYQNIPNPFSHSTTIGFELGQDAPATLNVFDVTGKTILIVHVEGKKGYNSVDIGVDQLTKSGVLYYQLESRSKIATRKMLLIK